MPVIPQTLWLILLGRGKVQQKALDELLILPADNFLKSATIEILYALQKNLEANKLGTKTEERELIMRLASLYQEDKARAKAEGIAEGKREEGINLILRLLTRKLGNLDSQSTAITNELSLEKLEMLAEALLDFNSQSDLATWFRENS